MEDILKKKTPMNVEKAAARDIPAAAYFTLGQGTPCGGQSWSGVEDAPCGLQSAPLPGWAPDYHEFLNTKLSPSIFQFLSLAFILSISHLGTCQMCFSFNLLF